MVSFQEALRNEASRLACRVLRNAGARDSLIERTVRSVPAGGVVADIADGVFDTAERIACSLGDNDPKPGDQLEGLPGQPGQCDGVRYLLTVTIQVFNGNPETQTFNNFWGPIEGIRIAPRENGLSKVFIDCKGRATTGPSAQVIPYQFASSSGNEYILARIDNIVPQDNFVDNCGTSDNRPRYSGPLTYNEGDTEVTQNVEIILDESVNTGPSLTIPFIYLDPSLELRPELELDVEPELSFGRGNGCDVDIELGDDNTSDNPDAPEDFGQEGDIVGAVVVSTKVSQFQTTTELGDGLPPTLYLPRCATLLFGLRVGNNRAWTQPQDCSVLVQYLDVPGDIPAYTFKVLPTLGFECEVFPVRKQPPVDTEPEVS